MTRRTPASLPLAAAAALALTACAPASAHSANHRNSGTGGFGAVETDPSAPASPDSTPRVHRSPPTTAPSPGQQGSDTLPFQCPDKTKSNSHTFTLTIKGHNGATKTISASAKPNP